MILHSSGRTSPEPPWGIADRDWIRHPARTAAALSAILILHLAVARTAFSQDIPRPPLPQEEASANSAPPEEAEDNEPSSWFGQPNVGYGPYHQVPLGFFNSIRLGFTPRAPVSLSQGSFEARVTESWAKVISEKPGQFNLDYEILRTEASVAYGLSDTTLLELDFDTASRVHGILDPFMNAFHDTFGIPLGPRGRLPNNSFRIELVPGQGRPGINLDEDAGRPFTRSIVLSAQQSLTEGDAWVPAISLSMSLRPPLGHFEPLDGGSPIDLSGSLGFSKSYENFYLYLAIDFSLYGDESFAGTPLRASQWGALGALEWNCLKDFSLVVQCLSVSGTVNSFAPFSRPSYELCCGFKWEVARDFRIDFALLHDVVDPINSPDFGFQLELSLRW